jgi:hypothetical protein
MITLFLITMLMPPLVVLIWPTNIQLVNLAMAGWVLSMTHWACFLAAKRLAAGDKTGALILLFFLGPMVLTSYFAVQIHLTGQPPQHYPHIWLAYLTAGALVGLYYLIERRLRQLASNQH